MLLFVVVDLRFTLSVFTILDIICHHWSEYFVMSMISNIDWTNISPSYIKAWIIFAESWDWGLRAEPTSSKLLRSQFRLYSRQGAFVLKTCFCCEDVFKWDPQSKHTAEFLGFLIWVEELNYLYFNRVRLFMLAISQSPHLSPLLLPKQGRLVIKSPRFFSGFFS